jgi:hypothetical protein
MEIPQVEKIISRYLEQSHIHNGFKVKIIKNETISTYDGLYPSFEIIYEGKQPKITFSSAVLAQEIEKYTGLKHNKHYWLGISWEE